MAALLPPITDDRSSRANPTLADGTLPTVTNSIECLPSISKLAVTIDEDGRSLGKSSTKSTGNNNERGKDLTRGSSSIIHKSSAAVGGGSRHGSTGSSTAAEKSPNSKTNVNSNKGPSGDASGSCSGVNNGNNSPANTATNNNASTAAANLLLIYQNASTYNREKVSKARWKSLTLAQQARYMAYAPPPTTIQTEAEESARRVRNSKRIMRQHWFLSHPEYEWPPVPTYVKVHRDAVHGGWEGPIAARQRITMKSTRRNAQRERELQLLVEGQPNSLDAIRLMEFCGPSVIHQNAPSIPQLGEREKHRVQNIMENAIES